MPQDSENIDETNESQRAGTSYQIKIKHKT